MQRTPVTTGSGGSLLTQNANAMLRYLIPVMHLVSVHEYTGPNPRPELRDRDDEPIWQTAVTAGADYVVSQNTRHFPPLADGRHHYRGVEYLTAVELIEDVLGERIAEIYDLPLPRGYALRSGRVP